MLTKRALCFIIKQVINENNFLDVKKMDETIKKFKDKYGLKNLKKLNKSEETLKFLFGTKDQNNESLTYILESDPTITKYFGRATPGSATTKILNYSKITGATDQTWNNKKTEIGLEKAINFLRPIIITEEKPTTMAWA